MNKRQLHKRLSAEQVRSILSKYCAGNLKAKDAIMYLGVSRSRFYQIIEEYKVSPDSFSLDYKRTVPSRTLDIKTEEQILSELKFEKEKIIDNPAVPTKRYNYSYIQQQLAERHGIMVSLPAIITRAKCHGYYMPRPPKKVHDREVITNYIGELAQHDASHHLFAPDAKQKWHLITTLDDYSRLLLFARLFLVETTIAHISALESVFLSRGVPHAYYIDSHSIFRYVKSRDRQTLHTTYTKFTDDVDPQWKQVLLQCSVEPIYAISPQAKGKIERPYQWLQDHLVRACVREQVTDITHGNEILQREVDAYNTRRIHSTTREIPIRRFEHARNTNQTLFREFTVPKPFGSHRDIFALREQRTVTMYRTISPFGATLKVSGVSPGQKVELRLYPELQRGMMEVRFWHQNMYKGSQRVRISDLKSVQFSNLNPLKSV
jgi:hypothetical protein